MPFSTSLLGEFITSRTALVIYWANIALVGAALYGAWIYAMRAGLGRDDVSVEVSAAITGRIVVAQALYAFGALLCLISTYWSIVVIVLVQLNYAIAPRVRWLTRTG